MIDISVIITGHREGILAGASLRSAQDAISHVQKNGAKTEVIVILDRPDPLTKSIATGLMTNDCQLIETNYGDPGRARNRGVKAAKGRFSCFLDADDFWSINWLSAAWHAAQGRPDVIWHSHCNIVFGDEKNIWWHIDSEGALYDPNYLRWANYWDAMSFAATKTYKKMPFRANDLAAGFGHEDWHWNVQTIEKNIPHKPVLGTIHFKRRRRNSQMQAVQKNDATIWPC